MTIRSVRFFLLPCIGVAFATVILTPSLIVADNASTGGKGINSQGLGLTGTGINIGQEEIWRSGKPGFDNAGNSHPDVVPTAVFLGSGAAVANSDTSDHAESVAGVMIGTDGVEKSVAKDAHLHSSCRNTADGGGEPDPTSVRHIIAAQHVALQADNDVRAINMSYGLSLDSDTLDGSPLLTRFVDWSARVHDVLYVVSGNEDPGGRPIPTDEFNGMTVAYSEKDAGGEFNRLDAGNQFTEDAVGPRRSIDLAAPGTDILMPELGGGAYALASGTSFAAPHVTGTVALLEEFAETELAAKAPRWDESARLHYVMKAVLMNSVDKKKDTGNGLLLGMEKTILDTGGADWLASDAYTKEKIPLDDELGTGQLNAKRAKIQFEPGEYDSLSTANIPLIGWDDGVTNEANDKIKYVFNKPLKQDSYVSITLAWDRVVELTTDANSNGFYDTGDDFTSRGLTDMDLYLLPKGAASKDDKIWSSRSEVDSVEHIFFKIPNDGEYEFWVFQAGLSPLGGAQHYGVAWWAVPACTGRGVDICDICNCPGDVNGDLWLDVLDIPLMVDSLLNDIYDPCADLDSSGMDDGRDLDPFIAQVFAVGPQGVPCNPPCTVTCDPGKFQENEADCGLDPNGLADDFTNGGCNSTPPIFMTIPCPVQVCGSAAYNEATQTRDTDWYELVVPPMPLRGQDQKGFTWTIESEFPAEFFILAPDPGIDPCGPGLLTIAYAFGHPCEPVTMTACVPTDATYWFVVAPAFAEQVDCGSRYNFSIAESMCIAPPPNDDCASATTIACGSSAVVNNLTATTDPGDPPFSCHFNAPDQGVGTVWYQFTATDTSAQIHTCDTTGQVHDTLLAVYDGSCGALTEIACSDDNCGYLSYVCVTGLSIGNTYLIQVASYDDVNRGEIELRVDCPCP